MSNRVLGGQFRQQHEYDRHYGQERMRFGFTGNTHPRPAASDFAYEDPNNADSILEMTRTKDSYENPPEYDHGDTHGYDRSTGQMHLFEVNRHASPWKVDYMAATTGEHNDARYTVPTLLGLAAQHSLNTTGRVPQADSSLSKHSKKIVDKLVSRGLVDNPFHKRFDEWDDGEWHDNEIDYNQGNEMAYGNRIKLGDPHKEYRHNADYAQKIRSSQVESALGLVRSAVNLRYDSLKAEGRYSEADFEQQPLVNARSSAGRSQEFHHTLMVRENNNARSNGRPRMNTSSDHNALPGMENPFPYRGA